jgi:hypothetical protein
VSDIAPIMRDLNIIFYLSVPYLLFPVQLALRIFFEIRTKRYDASKFTMAHYCELGCFISLILWELEKKRF